MTSISNLMKMLLFSFILLCCTHNVKKQKTDKAILSETQKTQPEQNRELYSKNTESKPKGAHEIWLTTCQNQLSYLESYEDPAPRLEWSKRKKEEVLKLAVKDMFELGQEWALPWENNDNGTELVNIEVNTKTATNNGYILSDGEVETTVEWVKDGAPLETPIRSWTGTLEGVKKKLEDKEDTGCLRSFNLKSWGKVQEKDVVVVLENTNEGDGCLQYRDDKWVFMEWISYGREPVYSIIIWQDDGEWKSTIRSREVFPLEKEEICQVLGEEWGVIPRKGPPEPLLIFGED